MAALIQMICSDCGYNSGTLRLGPTFMDPRFIIPAFDTTAQQIISADVAQMPETAIPYYSEKLYKKKDEWVPFEVSAASYSNVQEGTVFQLSKQHNFCPCCNSFSLQVKEYGEMD